MKRRSLIKTLLAGAGSSFFIPLIWADKKKLNKDFNFNASGADDRTYWVDLLMRMAKPILGNISKDEFKKNMPMEVGPAFQPDRDKTVGYMEAFCRLLVGMAPWLELPDDESSEGQLRKKIREQALQGIANGTDPKANDYFSWEKGGQPLVEAAFLAHAFLRAPKGLWAPLSGQVKKRVIKEFKALRRVDVPHNNWILFASIVEAFLASVDEQPDMKRVDYAVHKFDDEWYVGDGWYSDGKRFSFDHYNGYVIHCMQVDTLKVFASEQKYKDMFARAYKRMQRYAHHQERMVSPEGYPVVVGRSSTYRNGAFQPLAALALDDKLPENLNRGQIRAALTAVLKNIFIEQSFKDNGWLTLGYVGAHQEELADAYTTVGSLYLASLTFLPLGLPKSHKFWTSKPEKWTSQKVFDGDPFPKDYAVDY